MGKGGWTWKAGVQTGRARCTGLVVRIGQWRKLGFQGMHHGPRAKAAKLGALFCLYSAGLPRKRGPFLCLGRAIADSVRPQVPYGLQERVGHCDDGPCGYIVEICGCRSGSRPPSLGGKDSKNVVVHWVCQEVQQVLEGPRTRDQRLSRIAQHCQHR